MPWRIALCALLLTCGLACADDPKAPAGPPVTRPADGKLPHVQVDVKAKQVRVECEEVNAEMPLEFFCCAVNSNEHEAVMRSAAKASHIHLGLLMVGLEPGQPVHYSKAADKWLPPSGPPLHIFCEWDNGGKTVKVPAYRMLRNVKTKKEAPPFTWVFTGSKVMEDGVYAADVTGYLVSIVNFDLTMIDIPELASSANETLEWEINPDAVPKKGTKVWMIIEPAGKAPATQPDAQGSKPEGPIDVALVSVDANGKIELNRKPVELKDLTEQLERMKSRQPVKVRISPDKSLAYEMVVKVTEAVQAAEVPFEFANGGTIADPTTRMSDVAIDEARVKALKELWEKAIRPHRKELATAADTHYRVIASLRREQQRLIDESDRIQRVIDELQKEYQDMTTPRPGND